MIKKKFHILTVYALFISIITIYVIMAMSFPLAYIWATYEDLVGEWAQFYFFLLALITSVRIAFSTPAYRRFFALLSLACLYVVLEEISWGQRIFGWESPDYFKSQNLQGETNLHNIITGPYSTSIKAAVTYFLAGGLVAYGLIYQLSMRLGWRFAMWLNAKGLASPPMYLWPFFCTAAYLELQPFSFNEAEVAEILVSLALSIMAMHYYYSAKRQVSLHLNADWSSYDSRRFAVQIITSFMLVVSLSVATTFAVQAHPKGKERVYTRIENGVEKFASRYERYERWEIAERLYEYLLQKNPRYTPLLRNLARVNKKLGHMDEFDRNLQKALEISLELYQKKPGSAAVNRSLARTYRLMKDEEKAHKHLENALQIGLARAANDPENPDKAYSLGKTYALLGEKFLAFKEFEKSFKLNPTKKKFRKAYYKAKKKIEE
jgi:tetratricopeptide (TPR) repeat protein